METVVLSLIATVTLFVVMVVCYKLEEAFKLWKEKRKQKEEDRNAKAEAIIASLDGLPIGMASLTFSWVERSSSGAYVKRSRKKPVIPTPGLVNKAARYYAKAEQKGFTLRKRFTSHADFVVYVHRHVYPFYTEWY